MPPLGAFSTTYHYPLWTGTLGANHCFPLQRTRGEASKRGGIRLGALANDFVAVYLSRQIRSVVSVLRVLGWYTKRVHGIYAVQPLPAQYG